MATPLVNLPQEWLKILQENAHLKGENEQLRRSLAFVSDKVPKYTTQEEWRALRHPDASGDGELEEYVICSQCGAEIDEDGVCVFDTRDGQFIPAFQANFDFFCDHFCLSKYGQPPLNPQ